jgi:hypothetical protein
MSNQTIQTKEKTLAQATSEFREYVDAMRPPDPPRAAFADIELLAATYPLRIFTMRSIHPLETVLSAGYFDDLADVRLRKEDRIELVANFHAIGDHATLVVDYVNKSGGEAKVSILRHYERAA